MTKETECRERGVCRGGKTTGHCRSQLPLARSAARIQVDGIKGETRSRSVSMGWRFRNRSQPKQKQEDRHIPQGADEGAIE